ncbi:MAG: ABC transporter permease, partial [Pseudomonadota bacterium]
LVGDIIGIYGAFLVGVHRLDFSPATFLQTTWDFLEFWDVASGLIKAAVFGFIVALIGCFHGYTSERGAQGVGRATRAAVVHASILILAANFVMTDLFFA